MSSVDTDESVFVDGAQIEINERVPGTHTCLNILISVQVFCVGGQVILTGT